MTEVYITDPKPLDAIGTGIAVLQVGALFALAATGFYLDSNTDLLIIPEIVVGVGVLGLFSLAVAAIDWPQIKDRK